MMTEESKAPYEAPELKVHGTFERLTQGTHHGHRLDKNFPQGSLDTDLTFS
jgi:hypothetical protein